VPDRDQAELVAVALKGDRAAFAELVARHRPMLVAVCASALGDAELAEDAAQEAALLALTSLDRLRRPDSFGPWLAGIGLNVCRRWLRERSRAAWSWEAVQGGLAREWPLPGRDPAELAEAAEDARLLRDAVATLPPGQRDAVAMHYLAGMSQAQTAARAGTSVGAVKVRLHRARARLRELLAPTAPEREERRMPEHAANSAMVEMRVADVRRGDAGCDLPERHVVVLEEVGGDRRVPIWVGPFEGIGIAMGLRGVELPRPGPARFAVGLVEASGGTVREVRVTRLVDGVFYGEVVVDGADGERLVDARPSDALALALAVGAPVRVDAGIVETAAGGTGPWAERVDELPAGAAEIVADRQAAWDRERAAMKRERGA
jgi:RNA polymerase sigma factor (sigma-70 family)